MFKTLKLRGSSFIFSLSVMHIILTKMARYESCENTRFSIMLPRVFGLNDLSAASEGSPSLFSTGRNDVYGGRYL